ncbi:hypothetical protein BDY19DRAFT_927217 [Irpex rosettiformis]|uniref:Uncharacterized protein n=1 Tax=Irpex rosettiformis TaxID=378272 RepID=A0ACB8UCD3_9APHY|nr:hypothetical protein BDY19DRAFT_927217 [Irpex rosettiformis]
MQKNFPPPIPYEQQQQHQEMPAQYAPNAFQSAERVSLRLLAQRTIPQQMPPQHRMPPVYMSHPGIALIPVMLQQPQPQPTPPSKRPMSPETDEPKAKKAKGRGKVGDTNGATSKRSYNSKKRSDSIQLAIPNGMNGKVKDRAGSIGSIPSTPSELNMVVSQDGQIGSLQPELQFARCMSNRYRNEEFPRCVSCTRRWAGDTCRFQGIRYFLKNADRAIVGISFIEAMKADGPNMNFPVKWNIPLELAHIASIKKTVAKALLPVLKQEAEHINLENIVRRPRESDVRATCDTCMTSIFSSSWMCRLCGREACHECFEQVKELTTDRPGATEAEQAALQARREKHAHINPFFLSCTRRNEHRALDFSPMTRFSSDELHQAINDMEVLLTEPPTQPSPIAGLSESSEMNTISGLLDDSPTEAQAASGHVNGSHDPLASPSKEHGQSSPPDSAIPPQLSTLNTSFSQPPPQPLLATSSIPSHIPRYFTDAELTDAVFRELWQKGEPLVVTDVLKKFTLDWTPEYFKTKYGSQNCLILECQNDQNKRMTVGEFFSLFGQYEGRRDCWKLKDWPPSTDFKTAFPELYDDFASATPVPNYVRRDGVLNVASHFPSNAVAPDLGPKMYNAMASFESQGSKGSTRLHMDMADAANIMMYAANTPDGRPGTAAWDLFKAEDAPKIRKFLRKRFKGQYQHDPIHSQQFYLDTQLRQELYDEFQVKSYRVYQRPGDVVFIPAGCAHQVCNLADCIKVACDFVSPENINRCEILTKEFREQNQSMAWKEDVLQLRTMMWFAWLSCSRQEKELDS